MVISNNFIYFINVFILFIHTVYVSMCVLLTYILFLFILLSVYLLSAKQIPSVCVCVHTQT